MIALELMTPRTLGTVVAFVGELDEKIDGGLSRVEYAFVDVGPTAYHKSVRLIFTVPCPIKDLIVQPTDIGESFDQESDILSNGLILLEV